MNNIPNISSEVAGRMLVVGAGQLLSRTVVLSNTSMPGSDAMHESGRETAISASELPDGFILEKDSRLDLVIVIMPGFSGDITLSADLIGEGAEANISGLYICPGAEKVKISVELRHSVPHCSSRQLFKGIAGGTSITDFYGKIIVAQDAQKTEAYQENHSLLLSDGAKVNTKPQLEIYADDVKCSHGATIGRLDEEAQFYMRSRGISLEEARVLQIISFLSPVVEKVSDQHEHDLLLSAIDSAARSI